MSSPNETIKQQQKEIERLRREISDLTQAGDRVYMLPHTLRKGVGDAWRGYDEKRERPDNVPKVDRATETPAGPSNQEVTEFLAGQAIKEALGQE